MRDELDRYYTPLDLARACVKTMRLPYFLPGTDRSHILDSSVGSGNFIQAWKERVEGMAEVYRGQFVYHGIDIDPLATGLQKVDVPTVDNFLTMTYRQPYDYIIGNPPYKEAIEHVTRAMELVPTGYVGMLLRLGFLASKARHGFWKQNPLHALSICVERPSFTADGRTDGSEYGFFVWRRRRGVTMEDKAQQISWMNWKPICNT